ncbi:MAG: CHAP domain-containing protein [Bifidobacteriaceae bacterium]|jgi:hypothetical protein|nr:CHAP domain-containing protein [Bifidobacteriaceae bacterium]
MAYLGMTSVEEVEEKSKELKAHAAALRNIIILIDGLIQQLVPLWLGRDAEVLAKDWWPKHKSELSKIWARYRREELGIALPDRALGNGGQMAGNLGPVAASEASVGSLVSYGSGYGHVTVVEERLSDNPLTYRVSEMNKESRITNPAFSGGL